MRAYILNRLSRRGVMLGAAGLMATTGGWTQAAATPHAFDEFFDEDRTRSVRLSPSGARVARLRVSGTRDEPRGVVDILDAADDASPPLSQIDLTGINIEAIEWASENRLLIRAATSHEIRFRAATGSRLGATSVDVRARRILSMDVDTREAVVLFQNDRRRLRGSFNLGSIIDLLPDDPRHVLMAAVESTGVLGLHRVDVITGVATLIERGGTSTVSWLTQDGVPVMRRDINQRGTLETYYVRAPGETTWRMARRNRTIALPSFVWVGATGQPGVALVAARADGENESSLRTLDLATLAYGPALRRREGHDVATVLTNRRDRLVAAGFYADRMEYEFEDPAFAAHFRGMNRFFGDEANIRLADVSDDGARVLGYASGPREPGSWFVYDQKTRRLTPISNRTRLAPERLGPGEAIRVETRDGSRIDAYLTAPPGGRPGPLVALVHGGPEVRDVLDWDRQAQVFAAQGWWVIQPNFRGSGGYGADFARAGWRRWAGRMQEDVEDAVAQVVRDKGLNGDRVAIMGTSYGGYAALMGPLLRPDLYKAAISICGVGDLIDILAFERRDDDTPGKQIYEFWRERIGDPDTDAAELERASPRRRAAEFPCPVLLVHGVDDTIVSVEQSRRMEAALKRAGKRVEYVEVADAGHGDWEIEKEKELMQRYVALLTTAFT